VLINSGYSVPRGARFQSAYRQDIISHVLINSGYSVPRGARFQSAYRQDIISHVLINSGYSVPRGARFQSAYRQDIISHGSLHIALDSFEMVENGEHFFLLLKPRSYQYHRQIRFKRVVSNGLV
ncbi:hypothetical protein PFISCL1PPCAC_22844, partial [Pristionchus fissidentatus]